MKLINWNNLTFDKRNELVFAGRNQAYGAYELRTNYNKRVTYIMGGMVLFSFMLLGIKKIADRPQEEQEIVETIKVEQIDLTPPPPVEEIPPPPPPPPPPPMAEMVRFVPPVIKDNAVEEEPQVIQDDVKDTQVGTKNIEGDKDIVEIPQEKDIGDGQQAEIFIIVEEEAQFPGGLAAMGKYIQQNLQYPAMAREAGISGKCHLKFVVNSKGEIGDVQVLKGVPGCPDCDKEAVRVVKSMPKWKPAKMTGREVNCYFNLPISFRIQ
ncbi:MAG: energy transducer TonB [Bacteroidetes bacterium]|nr:energy transducer TonB [Bacteroidota bacterium]